MKKLSIALALFGICCLYTQIVRAWSVEGHRVVALIAEGQLKDMKVLKKVTDILGTLSLADVATCPDELREFENKQTPLSFACKQVFPNFATITGTSRWHFVNIPFPSTKPLTDVNAACGQACVLSKIDEFGNVLSKTTSSVAQKRQAISWLVHFIGDVHQPLHTIVRDKDNGGNDEQVTFKGEKISLHRLWDDGLVRQINPSPTGLAAALGTEITAAKGAENAKKTAVKDWAVESFHFAHDSAYKGIPAANGDKSVATIQQIPYVKEATPEVRQQIARAGVRLALFLNDHIK